MNQQSEAARKLQDGLEPYIKPREQANYIRRILALHIGSFSQDAPLNQPLPLAATSHDVVDPTSGTKSLHREYLEALKANVAARRQLETYSQPRPQTPEQQSVHFQSNKVNHLDEHLAILNLEQKRRKLSTVRRYLDQLVDQPAASPNYLDSNEIFANSAKLPSVPRQIVDSFVTESGTNAPNLKIQISKLEKTVLRAKLRLRQEEKLLEEAKARGRSRSSVVSNGVRLEALNTTRTELIKWIETELSVASGEERATTSDPGQDGQDDLEADPQSIATNLAEVKKKYAQYLESRREVLALVAHQPDGTSTKPDLAPPRGESVAEPQVPPINHLLVPYIERLLMLSRAQKSTISQKSHMNAILSGQLKSACQVLGHLAEESQLLPAYPMKESLRRRSGLVSELTSKKSGVPDIANRIRPWVFASDAAKITSLESVAETIETGQLSLEGSMKALEELENLLGIAKKNEGRETEADAEGSTEDDFWLDTGDSKDGVSRKHTGKTPEEKPGDVWSTLHGNLGLIGEGDGT